MSQENIKNKKNTIILIWIEKTWEKSIGKLDIV
jgi:hypothetical protein